MMAFGSAVDVRLDNRAGLHRDARLSGGYICATWLVASCESGRVLWSRAGLARKADTIVAVANGIIVGAATVYDHFGVGGWSGCVLVRLSDGQLIRSFSTANPLWIAGSAVKLSDGRVIDVETGVEYTAALHLLPDRFVGAHAHGVRHGVREGVHHVEYDTSSGRARVEVPYDSGSGNRLPEMGNVRIHIFREGSDKADSTFDLNAHRGITGAVSHRPMRRGDFLYVVTNRRLTPEEVRVMSPVGSDPGKIPSITNNGLFVRWLYAMGMHGLARDREQAQFARRIAVAGLCAAELTVISLNGGGPIRTGPEPISWHAVADCRIADVSDRGLLVAYQDPRTRQFVVTYVPFSPRP